MYNNRATLKKKIDTYSTEPTNNPNGIQEKIDSTELETKGKIKAYSHIQVYYGKSRQENTF